MRRTRLVQVACDRCRKTIGAVWLEVYTDGSRGLLAESAEHLETGRMRLLSTRLDRESELHRVPFWCIFPTHGVAEVSVGTLATRALSEMKKGSERSRRDTPRSAVLYVECSTD